LTQKELSERSGVPKAMITRLENGIPIRMDSLMELMRALGCL
ncbi:MAG: helix-turn-helix transcriptional regulator, partial [Lachnospiraceae bacterium]|nr:helix-turn-helix transcriptional regulator [Lachnospiraceae bacterium]